MENFPALCTSRNLHIAHSHRQMWICPQFCVSSRTYLPWCWLQRSEWVCFWGKDIVYAWYAAPMTTLNTKTARVLSLRLSGLNRAHAVSWDTAKEKKHYRIQSEIFVKKAGHERIKQSQNLKTPKFFVCHLWVTFNYNYFVSAIEWYMILYCVTFLKES